MTKAEPIKSMHNHPKTRKKLTRENYSSNVFLNEVLVLGLDKINDIFDEVIF